MITKERGEEEEDDDGDELREGCDAEGGGDLSLTEVVLVVRGRRIRVDRYMLLPTKRFTVASILPEQGSTCACVKVLQSSVQSPV